MSILEAVILGIVQGLTEFLPVSSSGHLAAASMLGFAETDERLSLFVILHLGTLGAVIWAMRKNIKEVCTDSRHLITPIVLSTAVTAVIGLLLKKVIENSVTSGIIVGIGFIVTAFLLITGELIYRRKTGSQENINAVKGLILGLFQGIAVMPGISRSGSTIAAGMFLNIDKKKAVEYSFLISIPAVLGAFILEIGDIMNLNGFAAPALGFISAFITGYIALKLLFKAVQSKFYPLFGVYTVILGITMIVSELIYGH